MTKVVAYPRGFLGFDIGLPIETRGGGLDSLLSSIKFNKVYDESRRVISNDKVEAMWLQVVNGERFTDSFDFREKILLLALHAFGTTNFLQWCRLQESSPYLTDMHKRFINDTLAFIENGKRSVNVISWQHLITPRKLTNADESPQIRYDFFGNGGYNGKNLRNIDLKDVLVKWVSQDNGFYDLLGTLHVFFGDPGKN